MYTSAIAKEITVRDIDRSCKNLHGNEGVFIDEKYNLKKAIAAYLYVVKLR